MIFSVGLYAVMIRVIPAHPSAQIDRFLFAALGFCALAALTIAFVMRLKYIRPSLDSLRSNPDDTRSLLRWRQGTIVSVTLAESAALYGVAIHFLGGTLGQSAMFLGVAAVAMFLWWPRQP